MENIRYTFSVVNTDRPAMAKHIGAGIHLCAKILKIKTSFVNRWQNLWKQKKNHQNKNRNLEEDAIQELRIACHFCFPSTTDFTQAHAAKAIAV